MTTEADSTTLEAGIVASLTPQGGVIAATADSAKLAFTADSMAANSPFGLLIVGTEVKFLRGGANRVDSMGRPVAAQVAIANPGANAAAIAALPQACVATVGNCYVATSADATAGAITIATGAGTAVIGATVSVLRGGRTATSDVAISWHGSTLTVANSGAYSIQAGDVISWVAAVI